MSRHRNVRNLDEDDYYDDYYDDYDEDEYYLEQQREKERRQKEVASQKAKQNQLKQQQKQHQKAKNSAKKKSTSSDGVISVVSGIKGSKKSQSIPAVKSQLSPGDGGPGIGVQPRKERAVGGQNVQNSFAYAADNGNATSLPQIPPEVAVALRSLCDGRNKNNNQIRPHLSIVILGHVDAGKSTLVGRLLLSLGNVSQRQLQKHKKASTAIGKSSFALAWFTDEAESERERGVTVDIATKVVRTDKYDFTILDAPGHKDFIPNMISGTASADCGLLVVAATTGEFEAGFAGGGNDVSSGRPCGQTREHVVLSRGLGVTQFVVAVNKLDAANPAWSKQRFQHIKSLVLDFLKENGFKEKKVTFIPVSGLTGVNVSRVGKLQDEKGWESLRKWYNGPTLIDALDGFIPAKREFENPLRMIIADVSSEGRNVFIRGRVVQGFVRAGDVVVVLPVGDEASVIRVQRGKAAKEGVSPYSFATLSNREGSDHAEKTVEDIPELENCALAGEITELSLSGVDPSRLSPGCVICHPHPSLRPQVKRKFEARVLVMEGLAVPIIRGSQVLLHMHSIDVPAVMSKLVSSEKRDGNNLKPRQNPRFLTGGVTATVEITLSEKLVIEESNNCKSLGRFVLRRGGDTIAIGLVDRVLA